MLRNTFKRLTANLKRPSYLDYQATTPVDPRVLDSMLPFLTSRFGNPHSRSHAFGWEAEDHVERARSQVGASIGAEGKDIIFTSGATESNNIAIKGVAAFLSGRKKHIITLQTEHKCILASCRTLEDQGWDVTYLPVQSDGLVDLELLKSHIRPDTALVSVMAVNNEIGVIQPLAKIGQICRDSGVLFHTDAAQAIGKVPIDVDAMKIDLLSISGHKLYGPKGIGALYLRRKPVRVRVRPIIDGGGQERGLRSGTLSPALVVGMGKASELAVSEMDRDRAHVERLGGKLLSAVHKALPKVTLNGSPTARYPGNLNLSFACVEGESLLMALAKTVSVSSGSACTSASLEPSYVLRAIGVNEESAHTSLRFGLGRFTTDKDVERLVDELVKEVERLRELSPLWEIEMEGGGPDIKWS